MARFTTTMVSTLEITKVNIIMQQLHTCWTVIILGAKLDFATLKVLRQPMKSANAQIIE